MTSQPRNGAIYSMFAGNRPGWLLPLASGLLLVFAYPPYSVPILPFVGLVPLILWLRRPLSARGIVLGSLAFATPYFGGNLYWMFALGLFTPAGYAGAAGVILINFTTFLIFPLSMNVLNHTRRVTPLVAAPALWVVSEHARTYGDLCFPWVTLGYSLDEWPRLIQHADVIGVYGISLWLVLINAAFASMLVSRREPRTMTRPAAILGLALALPAAYGVPRWQQVKRQIAGAPTISVAVIQPNVAQVLKWRPDTISEIYAGLGRLIGRAEALSPDLVVGPEAALPLPLAGDASRLPDDIPAGTNPLLLGGLVGVGPGETREVAGRTFQAYRQHYNSALLAAPDRSLIGFHGKQYLVPFTEQVPYHEVLGFLLPLMRKQFGRFVESAAPTVLEVPTSAGGVRLGSLICYEVLYPGLAATFREMGADLLVVISNDAWFGRTSFPRQHAAMCAMRAIEQRASVVRSANTGISAVYDPLGRVSMATETFREAVFVAPVPILRTSTIYDHVGGAVPALAYATAVVLLALAWRARPRPA